MDITTLALAKNSAKQYTDAAIEGMGRGIIYKGAVDYYKDLPNNASIGDCYSVSFKGSSGQEPFNAEYVWGKHASADSPTWIKLGEELPVVQVELMPTATQSNLGQIVQYVGATNSSYTNGYFYKNVETAGPIAHINKQDAINGIDSVYIVDSFTLPQPASNGDEIILRDDAANLVNVIYNDTSVDNPTITIYAEFDSATLFEVIYESTDGGLTYTRTSGSPVGNYQLVNEVFYDNVWDDILCYALFHQLPEGCSWVRIDVQPGGQTDMSNYYTKAEIDAIVENINSILAILSEPVSG